MEEHNCPLRKRIINDSECFETVMAILGMNAKVYIEKLFKEYPNCEDICKNCEFNKEKL
ncbi:MAG: hypothetical protein IKN09_03960 [Clostridia bacterium]|nr:hypothetical protein [Clostridia bacterium]